MEFYTTVLRESGPYWVALCLENGLVGQGINKEDALRGLREAIDSFEQVRTKESDMSSAPVSIKELHEFLTVEGAEPLTGPLEMHALYA
jgi:hypothetical protein